MTEAELCFSTLTLDEMRQAIDFMIHLRRFYGSAGNGQVEPGHSVDATVQDIVLCAMELAWLREVETRYGAEAWYLGMPTGDHLHGRLLDHFQRRFALNPDRMLKRPERRDRAPIRACGRCSIRYPRTDIDWPRLPSGELSVICKGCTQFLDTERAAAEANEAERQRNLALWESRDAAGQQA